MSLLREIAKFALAQVVTDHATDRARRLRSSARRDPPGWTRSSKRTLAKVADGIADDPDIVVRIVEAWWDGERRNQQSYPRWT